MVLKFFELIVGLMMFELFAKCLWKTHFRYSFIHFSFFSKSFILTTLGYTLVAFGLGAISWWGPKFLQLSDAIYHNTSSSSSMNSTSPDGPSLNPK